MSVATEKHGFKVTTENLSASSFGETTALPSKQSSRAELPRPASQTPLKVINSWLKNWQPAGLEAFQGLSQGKPNGVSNLITLWKSLVYKHIFLTSHHSHPKSGVLDLPPACLPATPLLPAVFGYGWVSSKSRLPAEEESHLGDLQGSQLHCSLLSMGPVKLNVISDRTQISWISSHCSSVMRFTD